MNLNFWTIVLYYTLDDETRAKIDKESEYKINKIPIKAQTEELKAKIYTETVIKYCNNKKQIKTNP